MLKYNDRILYTGDLNLLVDAGVKLEDICLDGYYVNQVNLCNSNICVNGQIIKVNNKFIISGTYPHIKDRVKLKDVENSPIGTIEDISGDAIQVCWDIKGRPILDESHPLFPFINHLWIDIPYYLHTITIICNVLDVDIMPRMAIDKPYVLNGIVHSNDITNGCQVDLNRDSGAGDAVFITPYQIRPTYSFSNKEPIFYTTHEDEDGVVDYLITQQRTAVHDRCSYGVVYPIIKPTEEYVEAVANSINNNSHCFNSILLDEFVNDLYYNKYTNFMLDRIQVDVCEKCGRKVFRGTKINDHIYCNTCRDTYFFKCSRCGRYEEIQYKEQRANLCRKCQERHFLLPYHRDYPDIKFYGGDEPLYLGVELEIDNPDDDDNSYVNEDVKMLMSLMNVSEKNFIYCSRDGSLNNGIEIITQPATLQYHKSLFKNYVDTFKKAINLGYRSHDTSTCGLHIHFNRSYFAEDEEMYITRLLYLVDKFWDNVVKFSRRDQRRLDRYAKKVDMSYDNYICEANRSNDHDFHYYAVNLANTKTIEFRMFKGSLKIDTFIATLEFVHACIVLAKNKSAEEIQRLEFTDIFNSGNYEYVQRYWEDIEHSNQR